MEEVGEGTSADPLAHAFAWGGAVTAMIDDRENEISDETITAAIANFNARAALATAVETRRLATAQETANLIAFMGVAHAQGILSERARARLLAQVRKQLGLDE